MLTSGAGDMGSDERLPGSPGMPVTKPLKNALPCASVVTGITVPNGSPASGNWPFAQVAAAASATLYRVFATPEICPA